MRRREVKPGIIVFIFILFILMCLSVYIDNIVLLIISTPFLMTTLAMIMRYKYG